VIVFEIAFPGAGRFQRDSLIIEYYMMKHHKLFVRIISSSPQKESTVLSECPSQRRDD
jgi:hypothetical protein